ncbi:enoyl-CoA hydratase/isomerase family protein [Dokdonella sp.]|uniref:enoyl-CoA hydratase/isomerase family protein n=1 Tax=Dokdonella sp. TaxID=2291710 RepID=UPI003C640B9E
MPFQNILCTNRGAIRTLTVNRPDKLNALNRETIGELQVAFDQAQHDESVRVVVLAGAGEKAFVAGADIAELQSLSPIDAQAFSRAGQCMMRSIELLGKPVVAKIQGFALGGGLELAMCCHLRIGSEKAKLGLPEITLGLLPGFGGTQRLLRLIGRAAALEFCLLGQAVSAQRAEQLGLLNRVVAAEQLDDEVDGLADRLAASAPNALAGILDAVLVGGECSAAEGMDFESKAFALCFSTDDMREGTTAFLEKRKPVFSGK